MRSLRGPGPRLITPGTAPDPGTGRPVACADGLVTGLTHRAPPAAEDPDGSTARRAGQAAGAGGAAGAGAGGAGRRRATYQRAASRTGTASSRNGSTAPRTVSSTPIVRVKADQPSCRPPRKPDRSTGAAAGP